MDRGIPPAEIPAIEAVRLADENRELQVRLQYLANRQVALEQRLERVENSIVFRLLRWLGPRLVSLGLPVKGIPSFRKNGQVAEARERYASWLKETTPLASHPIHSDGEPNRGKLVSIVLNAARPDRARTERAIASLNSQHHTNWELFVCTDSVPPDWLKEIVADCCSRQKVEIVPNGVEQREFQSTLRRCSGEFTAIVSGDALLEPGTLDDWLTAIESNAVGVYSDWDFITPTGRRHTPRFTPECSPELLSQTLYWGVCYLARTTAICDDTLIAESPFPPVHGLAVRLSSSGAEVRRIAKVLWHLQDGAPDPASTAPRQKLVKRSHTSQLPAVPPKPSDRRASIIICSRNAKLLDKCLKSLKPTLDVRDEVIVVAHQEGDPQALERTCVDHGARMIPYQGGFHFGVMNGLGVTLSEAPVICLLNDDVSPVTEDWLTVMTAQASRPEVGIVGALLQYPNGTIEHAGIAVGGRHFPVHVGRFEGSSPFWPWLRVTREVTAVTGACMVIRRRVWDELNGFDYRFPTNYNDVDLCLRAAQRGYKVVLEAGAVLTHEGCKTRTPIVRSEEHELLYKLWWPVMNVPDRFFNPQFENSSEPILLGTANGH
jgi:GT2 family glycosyltransferase